MSQPLIPVITVSHARDALDYYAKYMGATIISTDETSDGRLLHSEMKLPNDAIIYVKDVCETCVNTFLNVINSYF